MAQVIWAPKAIDDLESLVNYIYGDAPITAKRFAQKVLARVELLQIHPLSGGFVLEDESRTYREVLQGNYRIIYRVQADMVYIVALHHAARLLDPGELEA
jgi:addiction module RelE/StbE family toxin